jgi:hypothetical protein
VIPTAVMMKLATLGLSAAQAEAVAGMLSDVEAATAAVAETTVEKGREKARARWQKWKDKQPKNVGKRLQTPANVSKQLARVEGSSSKEEITGEEEEEERKKDAPAAQAREFDEFWNLFPNKVGKRDAEKAFDKARQRAPLDAILDGLRRYAAKRDDRPWCNPATFLNQNRWEDEPATVQPRPQSTASPPGQDFNAILDAIQGKHSDAHTGQTIDGSHERTDRGSAPGPVQLYAVPSGR